MDADVGRRPDPCRIHVKEYAQIALASGAIVGTILAALAGDWFGRRWTYVLMCVGSLAVGRLALSVSRRIQRRFSVGHVSGRGVHGFVLRLAAALSARAVSHQSCATGQGFGFNFGRILAAVGALQTGNLMAAFQE